MLVVDQSKPGRSPYWQSERVHLDDPRLTHQEALMEMLCDRCTRRRDVKVNDEANEDKRLEALHDDEENNHDGEYP